MTQLLVIVTFILDNCDFLLHNAIINYFKWQLPFLHPESETDFHMFLIQTALNVQMLKL